MKLDCGHEPSKHSSFTTGYGIDSDGRKLCYDCCAERERQAMIDTGKAYLYLSTDDSGQYVVTDWSGHLRFPTHASVGRHNIAGTRYDSWFRGPDNFIWWGVTYGDNTQLHHCKRTKQTEF
jgi:hypothetical protein